VEVERENGKMNLAGDRKSGREREE